MPVKPAEGGPGMGAGAADMDARIDVGAIEHTLTGRYSHLERTVETAACPYWHTHLPLPSEVCGNMAVRLEPKGLIHSFTVYLPGWEWEVAMGRGLGHLPDSSGKAPYNVSYHATKG